MLTFCICAISEICGATMDRGIKNNQTELTRFARPQMTLERFK
jgi:hypothetical protein